MKVVFLSNFYNHHQQELSNSLYKKKDCQYSFVATTPIDSERIKMGYQVLEAPFLLQYQNSVGECYEEINRADVVILGSAPYDLIEQRLKAGKLVYFYSERIYKKKPYAYEIPLRALKYYLSKGRYRNSYLLCASAFVASDYDKTKTFPHRVYKWGYFPKTNKYDISELMAKKDRKKILWAGRFLDWKHPDDAIRVAKGLKDAGVSFSMDIVGTGVMEDELIAMVNNWDLNACVNILPPVTPDQIRSMMESSGIFIFTSDRYEGWGAVLNESMNSGCAVVASHAIGSVPYLMKHKTNGLVYHSGQVYDLYKAVKYLIDNPEIQDRFGRAAYKTITEEWNAVVAAERLVVLSEHLLAGEKDVDLYQTGPCSRAEIIEDDWFNG